MGSAVACSTRYNYTGWLGVKTPSFLFYSRGCVVYTERAETAAVLRGTSHVTTKQRRKHTTSVDI